MREEKGEKCIILTNPLRLAIIKEMLLDILESQPLRRLLLTDLVPAFLTHYQLILLPQDYGFSSLEELVTSFPEICLIQQALSVPLPQPQATPAEEDSLASSASQTQQTQQKLPQQPPFSLTGDEPRVNTTREEVKEQQLSNPPTTTTTTFVCLADRSCLKQAAHRCLQILFNSPFGSIPEAEFRERFRTMFQEELDFELVRNEMAPFIMVRLIMH